MTVKILKVHQNEGWEVRLVVCEAFDGGMSIITTAQRIDGSGEPMANGLGLSREERLALTQYLIEHPTVILPRKMET